MPNLIPSALRDRKSTHSIINNNTFFSIAILINASKPKAVKQINLISKKISNENTF